MWQCKVSSHVWLSSNAWDVPTPPLPLTNNPPSFSPYQRSHSWTRANSCPSLPLVSKVGCGCLLPKQSQLGKEETKQTTERDFNWFVLFFSAGLLSTAALLPLIGVSFAFGLLLVNQELDMFHYLFAGLTFCQVYIPYRLPSNKYWHPTHNW